jgi:hypothetical protein
MEGIAKKILSLIGQTGVVSVVWLSLKSGGRIRRIVVGFNIAGSRTTVQVLDPSNNATENIPLEDITDLTEEV